MNSVLGPRDNTVLIVDDTPGNLEVISNYLKDNGIKTLIATNGETAIKRAKYIKPDLILLDVMMPVMDGFETCKRIKETEIIRDIPIIFMTALSDTEHKTQGFNVGAVDYVTKPVQKEELLARVNTHLEIGQYRRSLENEVKKRTAELETSNSQLIKEIQIRKHAEHSLVTLAEFSRNIGHISDPNQILMEILKNLLIFFNCESAALSYDFQEHEFKQFNLHGSEDSPLHQPSNLNLLNLVFASQFDEVVVYNSVEQPDPIHQYFASLGLNIVSQCHFMFVRALSINTHLISLYRPPEEIPFSEYEMEYARNVIREVNTVVRNVDTIRHKARMESELKLAATVQKTLFPKVMPLYDQLELSCFYQSASETGGDWYGFIPLDKNNLYVIIGDVTGHGTPAALLTATTYGACETIKQIYATRNEDFKGYSPAQILDLLNKSICDADCSNLWMTLFVVKIDLQNNKLIFANAAHNFPIVLNKNGEVHHLLTTGNPLGYKLNSEYAIKEMPIQKDDLIFFFTDGLIENVNMKGDMWGEGKLLNLLKNIRNEPIKDIVAKIVQVSMEFTNNMPLLDDITIVACRIR